MFYYTTFSPQNKAGPVSYTHLDVYKRQPCIIVALLFVCRNAIQGLGNSSVPILSGVIELATRIGTVPVSYTHLDVYKRQLWSWLREEKDS